MSGDDGRESLKPRHHELTFFGQFPRRTKNSPLQTTDARLEELTSNTHSEDNHAKFPTNSSTHRVCSEPNVGDNFVVDIPGGKIREESAAGVFAKAGGRLYHEITMFNNDRATTTASEKSTQRSNFPATSHLPSTLSHTISFWRPPCVETKDLPDQLQTVTKRESCNEYDLITFFKPPLTAPPTRQDDYDIITFLKPKLPKPEPKPKAAPKKERVTELKRVQRRPTKQQLVEKDELSVKNARRPWIPIGYYEYPNCACGLGIHVQQECKLAVERIEKSIEHWKSKGDSKQVDLKGQQFLDFKLQEENAKLIFGEKANNLPLNRSTIIYSSKLKANWTRYTSSQSDAATFMIFGNYDHMNDDMSWRCDMGTDVINPFLWRLFAGLPVNPKIPIKSAIVTLNDEIWIVGGKFGLSLVQQCGILAAHMTFFRNALARLLPELQRSHKKSTLPLEATNLMYRYNVVTKQMDKFKEMNQARYYHQAVVVNEKLFVVGGIGKDKMPLRSLEMYNQKIDIWELMPELLPHACYGMAACAFQKELYVLGGVTVVNGEKRLSDAVHMLDTTTMQWSEMKRKLPLPCAFATAVEHNRSIYVIGGVTCLNPIQITGNVYIYDFELDCWLQGFSLHKPRSNAVAHSIGDRLYVFGGRSIDGNSTAIAEHLLNNGLGWYNDVYLPVATAGQQVTKIKTELLPSTGHVI